MKKLTVTASKTYDVLIGQDLLAKAGTLVSSVTGSCKACIVSDSTVSGLYGKRLRDSLEAAGFKVCEFSFPPGEQSKNLKSLSQLLEHLAKNELTRQDILIALGGGITGDLTGFAAATYLRGVSYIQIPTTLLAAVDSSVGGKTGVNLAAGKNLAGAFWQPSLVLCDCNTFSTLPEIVIQDGIAEMIKYGMILDEDFFQHLCEKDLTSFMQDSEFLPHAIERCVAIKRDIVCEDERDTGRRMLLNFGHTAGHAIEKCSQYHISHGHAVAIGMVIASRAAWLSGRSKEDCSTPLREMLCRYGLPSSCAYTATELSVAALMDKKRSGDRIAMVLPEAVGRCRLEMIDVSTLERFIGEGMQPWM